MSAEIEALLMQADEQFNPTRDRAYMPLRAAIEALDKRVDLIGATGASGAGIELAPIKEAVDNLAAKAASYDVKLRLDATDRELLSDAAEVWDGAGLIAGTKERSARIYRLLCRLAQTPVEEDEHARMDDEGGILPTSPRPTEEVTARLLDDSQPAITSADYSMEDNSPHLYWNGHELKRGLRVELSRGSGSRPAPAGWYTIVGVNAGVQCVQVKGDKKEHGGVYPLWWVTADRIITLGKIVDPNAAHAAVFTKETDNVVD